MQEIFVFPPRFLKKSAKKATTGGRSAFIFPMLATPDTSPFALTEHVFAMPIAGHSLLFWTANGLVLVGVGAAIVWGTRAMINGALGKR